MQPSKIRVMIVEDHPLFGAGLKRVLELEDDIEVVAEAHTGKEAVELAEQIRPDVVIMDVNLPEMNGLQATREITTHMDNIGVIVITAYHDDEQLFHALRAGAMAYYPKDVQSSELIPAIRQVARGNYVVGDMVMSKPQVASWLLRKFEEMAVFEDADVVFSPLTPREMEILKLITKGYSNKEIARALGISRQTVKNHMSAILRKLAVNDRTQAAVLALKRGWIPLTEVGE
ncbi:MAG: response regulator transcription factor [Chloroflexi bacterium]|nr:response regulator transcription factor [Chloroflexota bacterium]